VPRASGSTLYVDEIPLFFYDFEGKVNRRQLKDFCDHFDWMVIQKKQILFCVDQNPSPDSYDLGKKSQSCKFCEIDIPWYWEKKDDLPSCQWV
jgi:hypothetical protein